MSTVWTDERRDGGWDGLREKGRAGEGLESPVETSLGQGRGGAGTKRNEVS